MIAKFTRTLSILTALILSLNGKTLAVVRYVNITNPTPGAGTSWATAFNDLQSALAVSTTFDQIWIAQGTYKPSSPAGRSATFTIPGGIKIYGGFSGSGTETLPAQANPTLYPTILSGDIGVAGNASDNCYHVVTLNANLWIGECHGVTIRDGQADAGSPSVAQPDNTGGGVLFLCANTSNGSGTYFYNCTFTNNYAFYGGAMGSYGISSSQVNYNATNCFFHDNQAVYGGAVYNTIVATDYLYVFEDDLFYNNTASSGAASVWGSAVTNGTSTELLVMENCLFYNEAAPIFTNDFTNSAFSSVQFDYNIVWTSGVPYTSGYSGGNTPLAMSNSDIDGTFPPGSNIDADPLFVNAAGYDFHVSPCSPVIDQGPSFAPTTTDIGGNPRKQGPAVDLGPYETLKGTAAAAPTVTTPVGVCLNSTPSDLSGDVTGASLLWYTSATGGTGSSTAPTPVTTATGTTQYYVTQTPAGSCESPRQEIDVTVNPRPANPTYTAPPTYCVNGPANALLAHGTSLLWYATATGGTGNATVPTPSTTTAGTTTYYVTQTVSGCESQRTPIPVTVMSSTAAPTAVAQTYCENATASPLTATGANLLWYTAATGGTGSATAPTPSTASLGTTTYYVTQTNAGSCESGRTPVTVTIAPGSTAPPGQPTTTYCQNASASPLTATGANLLWYTAATGGTGSATAPTPSTASIGSTTYYVSQTPAASCESPRTPVSVTINPSPSVDFTWSTACEGKATKITASSSATGQYTWDFGPDAAVSGTGAGPYEVTWTTPNTYTVLLTMTEGGCQGQAQHVITVNANPKVGIIAPTSVLCLGADIPLEAYGASTYQWSPATDLSNPAIFDPVAHLQNNVQYTVTGTDDNGCFASAAITLDIPADCSAYYIPDAFSPNGDGKNDEFRVKTADVPRAFSLLIFNRFGGKVFESSNVGNGWNGTIGGNNAPTGAYVYVVQATTSAGTPVKRQGTIMLIR